jgi:ankyrin repeat protein
MKNKTNDLNNIRLFVKIMGQTKTKISQPIPSAPVANTTVPQFKVSKIPYECTEKELKQYIVSHLTDKKLFEYLDELQRRTGTVDYYYYCGCSLPYIIMTETIDDFEKYKLLDKLFKKYTFDLNRNVADGGNIIVNSIALTQHIPLYHLFWKNGADLNSTNIGTDNTVTTALDMAHLMNRSINLIKFLEAYGAVESSCIKYNEKNCL